MKIDINDDFDTTFQNEIFAGFTLKQCVAAGIGLVAGFGSAIALYHYTGLPIRSVYLYCSSSNGTVLCGWLFHISGKISCKNFKRDMVRPSDGAPDISGGRTTGKYRAGIYHEEEPAQKEERKEERPWPYLMRTSGSGTRNG